MAAFSLTELLFVLGLVATLGGLATAHVQEAVADARAAGAARYLSARLHDIRTQAIVRGAATAMRVSQVGTSYQMSPYVDGNGNGVLARDIQDGIDVQTAASEMLSERFPGVEFGALPGLPAVDSGTPPGADPIRLGVSKSVTFTPLGTASPGSLYLLGPGDRQFAVRIYGETGKTRVLRFNQSTATWMPLTTP